MGPLLCLLPQHNNLISDNWPQENIVAGADRLRDDQDHHQGGGQQERLGEPGHVVQDGIGHVRETPCKNRTLNHTNISLTGQ